MVTIDDCVRNYALLSSECMKISDTYFVYKKEKTYIVSELDNGEVHDLDKFVRFRKIGKHNLYATSVDGTSLSIIDENLVELMSESGIIFKDALELIKCSNNTISIDNVAGYNLYEVVDNRLNLRFNKTMHTCQLVEGVDIILSYFSGVYQIFFGFHKVLEEIGVCSVYKENLILFRYSDNTVKMFNFKGEELCSGNKATTLKNTDGTVNINIGEVEFNGVTKCVLL